LEINAANATNAWQMSAGRTNGRKEAVKEENEVNEGREGRKTRTE
jgi:hypothetical protein